MRKKRVSLGILVAVVATGCGGDAALTKRQYVSKLNAACADFSEREKEIGDPQTLADLVQKGPRILDSFEQTIVAIRDLEAPDEIADQAERLVELADEQRDVIAELIEAAKANNVARVRALVPKNEALNEEAGSIARKLGAGACAER